MKKATICIYVKPDEKGDYKIPDYEGGRVYRLFKQLNACRMKQDHDPIDFVLSVYPLPIEKDFIGKTWIDSKITKQRFTAATTDIADFFNQQADQLHIKIEDFSDALGLTEKYYIKHIIIPGFEVFDSNSGGDMLDMMKMRAIINSEKSDHLQLDSKTLIHDVQGFYDAVKQANSDQAVVNLYTKSNLTVNSKVVFTPKESVLRKHLRAIYYDHFLSPITRKTFIPTKGNLTIYNRVYCRALFHSGFTYEDGAPQYLRQPWRKYKTPDYINDNFLKNGKPYLVNLDNKRNHFKITNYVFIAVDGEWKSNPLNSRPTYIKAMEETHESLFIGDALFNYACYQNLVVNILKMESDPLFKKQMNVLHGVNGDYLKKWFKWIVTYEAYCESKLEARDYEKFDVQHSLNAQYNKQKHKEDSPPKLLGLKATHNGHGFFETSDQRTTALEQKKSPEKLDDDDGFTNVTYHKSK